MKKIITLFFLLGTILVQAQTYTLESSNEPYEDLVGSTSLNNGQVWDDPAFTVPLGFEFTIGNFTFDTLFIIDEGLGGGISNLAEVTTSPASFIIPVGQDIIDLGYDADTSMSEISFLTTGDAGSRILKIEYNNIGFIDDPAVSDFMNFQVWLYETSNTLEYRYGLSQIDSPNDSFEELSGPIVGFIPNANLDDGILFSEGYLLEGDPANPTLVVLPIGDEDIDDIALGGVIPDGTVYSFIVETLGVTAFSETELVLYPNPATDFLNIQNFEPGSAYQVFNNLGQQIKVQIDNSGVVNIENLRTGFYTLQLETPQGNVVEKFMKQ